MNPAILDVTSVEVAADKPDKPEKPQKKGG